MKKIITICIALFALLATAQPLAAQYYETIESEDTQLHTGFDVGGKFSERWGMNFGTELYYGNNMSEYQKLYARLMVDYYLLPNLRLSPMLMQIVNQKNGAVTMVYDFNVFYTHRINKLSLTLRGGTRLQDAVGVKPKRNGQVHANPEFMLRGQIAAGYRLMNWLEPYANIEAFYHLNPATDDNHDPELYTVGHYLPRVRSNVGLKFHLTSQSAISLYWRYDHTKSKYLSYELADGPFGIITKNNVVNFLGIFYHQKF